MTTKQETILAAVVTLLAGVTGINGNVWRSRTEAIRREETPSLIVEPIQDIPAYNVIDFAEWTLQFSVKVFTRGSSPDNLADSIVQSVYALLMADRTLIGKVFDITPIGFYYQILEGDQPVGITDLVFQTTYRTKASDLTQ